MDDSCCKGEKMKKIQTYNKQSFEDWMSETNSVSRFALLRWGVIGMFCGACLTLIYMLFVYTV